MKHFLVYMFKILFIKKDRKSVLYTPYTRTYPQLCPIINNCTMCLIEENKQRKAKLSAVYFYSTHQDSPTLHKKHSCFVPCFFVVAGPPFTPAPLRYADFVRSLFSSLRMNENNRKKVLSHHFSLFQSTRQDSNLE